ncbi:hypothetical protein IV203_005726 [Nitzschia inconspicua]|uniref:Uncharacterized protein n=1 Tax=Nitzschia inconspicua TaxID=303405 RepID=A0A9K3KN00_9STRA|nr:hypothetical protein IV203_005726 [Nitzschia inconspicua]
MRRGLKLIDGNIARVCPARSRSACRFDLRRFGSVVYVRVRPADRFTKVNGRPGDRFNNAQFHLHSKAREIDSTMLNSIFTQKPSGSRIHLYFVGPTWLRHD